MYQIGESSAQADVPEKTIRYYEEIGLLPPARRNPYGYRVYDEADVECLRFIRRARALDFALDEIKETLAFHKRNEPPCKYVMDLMHEQIDKVEERIPPKPLVAAFWGNSIPTKSHLRSRTVFEARTAGANAIIQMPNNEVNGLFVRELR
ncbi:MAG: MerR family transcriptional regulator [Aggregatilineales bacterium]